MTAAEVEALAKRWSSLSTLPTMGEALTALDAIAKTLRGYEGVFEVEHDPDDVNGLHWWVSIRTKGAVFRVCHEESEECARATINQIKCGVAKRVREE